MWAGLQLALPMSQWQDSAGSHDSRDSQSASDLLLTGLFQAISHAANWREFTGWKVAAIKKEHSSSRGGCHWIVFTSVWGWLRMKDSKEINTYVNWPVKMSSERINCKIHLATRGNQAGWQKPSASFRVTSSTLTQKSNTERHRFDNKERKSTGEVSNRSVWMFYSINSVQCWELFYKNKKIGEKEKRRKEEAIIL